MSRAVHVAAIQPPAVGEQVSQRQMEAIALDLVDQAGDGGADIVCLPEYLNVIGATDVDWHSPPAAADAPLLYRCTELARAHAMHVLLPLLVSSEGRRYNRTIWLNRHGEIEGHYDKTHLTQVESSDQKVSAGNGYPVFATDFGCFGIMTCYDGHFPEVCRILALNGAEIVFFPTLQRRMSAEMLELQVRCRAVDDCVWIVRASYGHADEVAWQTGMTPGKSCIVDFEGTVLADCGPRVGICQQMIDLDRARVKERSFGGQVGDARHFLRQDRRPETYSRLQQG